MYTVTTDGLKTGSPYRKSTIFTECFYISVKYIQFEECTLPLPWLGSGVILLCPRDTPTAVCCDQNPPLGDRVTSLSIRGSRDVATVGNINRG